MSGVEARLEELRGRVERAGGSLDRIRLVAVTKGHPRTVVDEVVAAGLLDVGENYAQELLAKAAEVEGTVRWHFVGRLQSNKVRSLAGTVTCWQSVDRSSLVRELARRAPGATVLVQVDISGEPSKGGVEPSGVERLVDEAREAGLDVAGLMGVASQGPPRVVGPQFASLRAAVDRLGLAECSMGMSADLEVAIAEGTTMLRIGTALVGERPPRR